MDAIKGWGLHQSQLNLVKEWAESGHTVTSVTSLLDSGHFAPYYRDVLLAVREVLISKERPSKALNARLEVEW